MKRSHRLRIVAILMGVAALLWMGCAASGPAPNAEVTAAPGMTTPSPVRRPTLPLEPPPTVPTPVPRTAAPAPSTEPTDSGVAEKPAAEESQMLVTEDWFDTDIRDLLGDAATQVGAQVVVDQLVQGTLTLSVKDMPFEELLDFVTTPLGATYKRLGPKKYFIGGVGTRNPSFPRMAETSLYRLNYVSGTELRDLLPDWAVEYVRVASQGPYVVISAPEIYRKQILRIIRDEIDRPPVQVTLHMMVTELTEDMSRALGLSGSFETTRTPTAAAGTATQQGLNKFSITREAPGRHALAVTTIRNFTGNLLATIEALEQLGKAKIKVNTRLTTQNGKEALLTFGLQQYFRIETGTVAFPRIELEQIDSGVTVRVTPQVAENGDITVSIQPQVNDVVSVGEDGLPVIQQRSVQSTVRVRDGETIVIAGMVEEREHKLERRVPLLGAIPLLGHLFKKTESRIERREVAVFITPELGGRISPSTDDFAAR